jgi:hypothetical protein
VTGISDVPGADMVKAFNEAPREQQMLAVALLGLRWDPDVLVFSKRLYDELNRLGWKLWSPYTYTESGQDMGAGPKGWE